MTEPFLWGERNCKTVKCTNDRRLNPVASRRRGENVTTECDVCLPESVYLGAGEVSSKSGGGSVEVSQLGGAG